MGSIGISNGGSMNKKLILTLALMGISGSMCGMGAQKVAQASRFSWAAIKASMPTWGKAYSKAKQQVQSPYRSKPVNFRPLGAAIAGSAIASTSLGVAHAKAAPTVFNVENIDKHPEMKAAFATFVEKNIVTPTNGQENDNLVKGVVHFINTYPDQVPHLVAIARDKGCAVHRDIQKALACHDKTFTCTTYLSPSYLVGNVFGEGITSAMIQVPFAAMQIPAMDQNIMGPVENSQLAGALSQERFKNLSLAQIDQKIMSPDSAQWGSDERNTWSSLRNYVAWQDEGIKLGINKKTVKDGCAECSPEYNEAWKIAGKNMRNQLGKDIARGAALGMAQSIATDMINEKINDRQVSKVVVQLATPLVANAYNKQFTLRNNTEGVLAVGIGMTINAAGSKTASHLPMPTYNKNSYNNLVYYATHGAYWIGNSFPVQLVKDVAVAVASGVLANKLCDKAFGQKPGATIPVASVQVGDY